MPYVIGFLSLIGLGTLITGAVFVAAMLLADVRERRARVRDAAQQVAALAAYTQQHPSWQSAMSIPVAFTRIAEEPAAQETATTVADITRVYQWLQGYRAHTYAECRWLLQQEQASEAVDGQAGESL